MKATEVTQHYHDTWNGRDADALVAAFTKDGTFRNPDTYPGVSGEALAAFVKKVWTAFPDFQIELLNAGEIEPGLVAHHWLIHCTNTGQGMDGSAPTGRTFTFKGASIIQVEGDKILSDQCYFDRLALAEPLSPSDVGFYAEAGRYTKRRYALKAGCVPALAGDVRAGGQGFALHAKGGEGAKALALATHIPQ